MYLNVRICICICIWKKNFIVFVFVFVFEKSENLYLYLYLIKRIWTQPCRAAPSHYLNQCWNIVNSNLRNKLQWNIKRNSGIFIQENAFENVVCEMASICLGLNVLISAYFVAHVGKQKLKLPRSWKQFKHGGQSHTIYLSDDRRMTSSAILWPECPCYLITIATAEDMIQGMTGQQLLVSSTGCVLIRLVTCLIQEEQWVIRGPFHKRLII